MSVADCPIFLFAFAHAGEGNAKWLMRTQYGQILLLIRAEWKEE